MRIIAGELRGRKLRGPRGLGLRPTSDRLKQTLFDILGPSVRGSVFLDGFAGTGAIGLEAISRGAREVLFVDSGTDAVRLIRQNLEGCRVRSGFRILQRDIFTSLRELARQGFVADTVFFDPPYAWAPYEDLLELVFRTGVAGQDTLVVVEHHAKASLPECAADASRARTVVQGDKCLSFYRSGRNPESAAPPGSDTTRPP